jgi:putative membrane protein
VAAGADELTEGADDAATGAGRVAAGAGEIADGADDAAAGAEQLSDGADELADGADDAAAGANELADGNGQIADGADELADGLGEAASGSGQLADGLETASGSAPQIVDGASRLSDEGMSQLKAAADDTASNFGTEYAVIEAATERAVNEAMPFGGPEGAISSAAYSLSIAGAEGEGGRNIGRTLAALAIFGGAVGIGILAARRRSAA